VRINCIDSFGVLINEVADCRDVGGRTSVSLGPGGSGDEEENSEEEDSSGHGPFDSVDGGGLTNFPSVAANIMSLGAIFGFINQRPRPAWNQLNRRFQRVQA